jgi:hypothetical protein
MAFVKLKLAARANERWIWLDAESVRAISEVDNGIEKCIAILQEASETSIYVVGELDEVKASVMVGRQKC